MVLERSLTPTSNIADRIFVLRGKRVMLDRDLAELYGVEVRTLNQAVTRNIDRFPEDFTFKLSLAELQSDEFSRSQIVILKKGSGSNIKYPPRVFTEQGVAMLSSVLTSKRAIQVNIQIIRAFIHLRELLASNATLRSKVEEMEQKYDRQLARIFRVLQSLIVDKTLPPSKIGFKASQKV